MLRASDAGGAGRQQHVARIKCHDPPLSRPPYRVVLAGVRLEAEGERLVSTCPRSPARRCCPRASVAALETTHLYQYIYRVYPLRASASVVAAPLVAPSRPERESQGVPGAHWPCSLPPSRAALDLPLAPRPDRRSRDEPSTTGHHGRGGAGATSRGRVEGREAEGASPGAPGVLCHGEGVHGARCWGGALRGRLGSGRRRDRHLPGNPPTRLWISLGSTRGGIEQAQLQEMGFHTISPYTVGTAPRELDSHIVPHVVPILGAVSAVARDMGHDV